MWKKTESPEIFLKFLKTSGVPLELKVHQLNFFWNTKQILKNVEFSIKQGQFTVLCGKNGSGKSTLLKILSGLLKPAEQTGRISKKSDGSLEKKSENGKPFITDGEKTFFIEDFSNIQKARMISYMQQNEFSAWNQKTFDFIQTGRFCWSGTDYTKKDSEIVLETAEKLNIHRLLERGIYSLSGGEFQKVRIARALVQKTEFLLLDEPASAMDITAENEFLNLLKETASTEKIGICAVLHNINSAARFADRIALLPETENHEAEKLLNGKTGRQAFPLNGTAEQIFTEEIIQAVYDHELKIYRHPVYNCPQIG